MINAQYGSLNERVDVTDFLNQKVHNDQLLFHVSNFSFGIICDPISDKVLEIEYEYDGQKYTDTYAEGAILSLPNMPLKKIVVNADACNLENVTLCTYCWGHESLLNSHIWAYQQFSHAVLFNKKIFFIGDDINIDPYKDFFLTENIQVVRFNYDYSREYLSRMMIKELNDYIQTDFVMIFQHDGFISNPSQWDDMFLQYDYIGAPWWYDDHNNVGNGGFSIRSKKLLEALSTDLTITEFHPEDHIICRKYGDYLRNTYGIVFAPESIAAKFSVEAGDYSNQFGFHSFRHLAGYINRLSN